MVLNNGKVQVPKKKTIKITFKLSSISPFFNDFWHLLPNFQCFWFPVLELFLTPPPHFPMSDNRSLVACLLSSSQNLNNYSLSGSFGKHEVIGQSRGCLFIWYPWTVKLLFGHPRVMPFMYSCILCEKNEIKWWVVGLSNRDYQIRELACWTPTGVHGNNSSYFILHCPS